MIRYCEKLALILRNADVVRKQSALSDECISQFVVHDYPRMRTRRTTATSSVFLLHWKKKREKWWASVLFSLPCVIELNHGSAIIKAHSSIPMFSKSSRISFLQLGRYAVLMIPSSIIAFQVIVAIVGFVSVASLILVGYLLGFHFYLCNYLGQL